VDQPKYAAHNAEVLGVSVQSVASHKDFCAKQGLNFKLLSDSDHKVSKAYGSLTDMAVVKFSARHSFLIDPSGKIAKVYTDVNPASHSEEVLSDLAILQKAEVKP
jgi:peroxiredoxin Q/BCP